MQARVRTGKILRPDVEDDVLRKPVSESKFRYPSPGSQPTPVVPQGPYENVFNIEYHSRDVRRRHTKHQIDAAQAAATAGLPPTPGTPARSKFLGMAGDFDRVQQ
ncbi:NADH:ubiquinone oxidoreductase subunit B14.5a [Gracilaria domingensis]|nr:NADH:ubiquinone oxidoreductase subunit B14.5a [Gracilaria domingensis]